MTPPIDGATRIAGVVGAPVRHSLSPLIHNAWLGAAGENAIYLAFPAPERGLKALIDGLRGGVALGLNVTLPFKEEALALADEATDRARKAGAANLLVFRSGGVVSADNTDGAGLVAAFAEQAPAYDMTAYPAVVLGAGGAARGAVAALLEAGAPEVRIVNRTLGRAEAIRAALGSSVLALDWSALPEALSGAGAVVNATTLGLNGVDPLEIGLRGLTTGGVVMDMVYRPLRTAFLARAASDGFMTVDGLAMLIGQAEPSFAALFGRPAPKGVDVRGLALKALGAQP